MRESNGSGDVEGSLGGQRRRSIGLFLRPAFPFGSSTFIFFFSPSLASKPHAYTGNASRPRQTGFRRGKYIGRIDRSLEKSKHFPARDDSFYNTIVDRFFALLRNRIDREFPLNKNRSGYQVSRVMKNIYYTIVTVQ